MVGAGAAGHGVSTVSSCGWEGEIGRDRGSACGALLLAGGTYMSPGPGSCLQQFLRGSLSG